MEPTRMPQPADAPADGSDGFGHAVRTGLRWSFATQFAMRLASFASGIVVFRLLVPAEYGEFALALAVVSVLLSCNDLGQDMAVINWSGDDVDRAQRTAASLAMGFSIGLYGVCYAVAPVIADLAHRPPATGVIRLLGLLVLVDGYVATPRARLYKSIRQRHIGISEMVAVPVYVAVTVVLVALGAGATGPVVGTLVSGVVNAAVALTFYGQLPGFGFDRSYARRLLAFGVPASGTTVVEMALLNVDTLVVANRLGPTALGFYALAFNVSSWPSSVITQSVRKVAQPALTRLHAEKRLMTDRLRQAFSLLLNVLLPVCLVLGVLAQPLVHFLYSAKSLPAAPVLSWLAILGAIRVAMGFLLDVLIGMGRPRATFRAQLWWLVAAVPALILGAEWDGVHGAAMGNTIAAVVVAVPVYLWEARRAGLGPRTLLPDLRRPLVAAVLAGLAGWGVSQAVSQPLLALMAGSAAIALVYVPVAVPRSDLATVGDRLRRRGAVAHTAAGAG
jgi:PST family polysaccharide transporter